MPLPNLVPRVIRGTVAFNACPRALYKPITEVMLSNAVNGGSFDVALGFLPPGAVLASTGPLVKLNAQFTGGGATAVGMTIGTAAAPTLLMTSFDVFGATASGSYVNGSPGAQRVVPAGGQAIVARFTPDGSHNLTALTAGSVEVMVPFSVPDPKWA